MKRFNLAVKSKDFSEWWEPEEGLFFSDAYFRGDHSIEGWLEEEYLSIEQRTYREVSGVLIILNPQKSDSILDVPCGWGKHTLCLSSQGFNVIGVDINPNYIALAEATRKASGIKGKPSFYIADMRRLEIFKGGQFNFVLNLVLSFGFFDDAGNKQTLREFARVLKPNGKLLIHTDINPPRVLNGRYRDRLKRRLADGSVLIVREEYDKQSKRLNGTWTIVQPNGGLQLKRNYSLCVYTNEEMEKILKQAGLVLEEIYGSLESFPRPYSEETQEVVYVARKIMA